MLLSLIYLCSTPYSAYYNTELTLSFWTLRFVSAPICGASLPTSKIKFPVPAFLVHRAQGNDVVTALRLGLGPLVTSGHSFLTDFGNCEARLAMANDSK